MTISSSKGEYILSLLGLYKRNVLFERYTLKWGDTDYPTKTFLLEKAFPQYEAAGIEPIWVLVHGDDSVEVFEKKDNYAGNKLTGAEIKRFFREHQGIDCGVFVEVPGMPEQYEALTWK